MRAKRTIGRIYTSMGGELIMPEMEPAQFEDVLK